jgi:voltage-gated potassium channel
VKRLAVAPDYYRRVIIGVVCLAVVLVIGTSGFMLIEGWSFLDALYMTVTTVTTVGFREVAPLGTAGRIFTIALVLIGVGVAFYILTAMVAAIIEGDLAQFFGARRMRTAIERLSDHYIVCGYGRVGSEIGREFKERRVPFVVIDMNDDGLERARADRVLLVEGDATQEETLIAAGIQRCRAIIAASDTDAGNTFITLTAKGLRSDVFVIARVGEAAVERKLRLAGADRVISPYAIGGRRMALAALQPVIADFIDIVPGDSASDRILAEFAIDEASGLAGKQLSEALAGAKDVVVLAVRDARGSMVVGPPGDRRLSPGDQVIVFGNEDELRSIGAVAAPK